MDTIKVYAVIKGYHVHKVKPMVGSFLKVEPDLENADDRAMGVYDSSKKLVGYVPATPITLHSTFFDIYSEFKIDNITCEVTGAPHASQNPWPAVNEKGGGAVIPCIYHIEADEDMKELVWQMLRSLIRECETPGLIFLERCDQEPCKFFMRNGYCKFGDKCHFKHDEDDGFEDFDDESFGLGFGMHAGGFPFDDDDLDELWSQGINPYKEDVGHCLDVLSALNGGDDDYDLPLHFSGLAMAAPATKKKKPCFAFQKNGQCRFGSLCRYSHSQPPLTPTYAAEGASASAAPYCRYHFSVVGPSCKFGDQCHFRHS